MPRKGGKRKKNRTHAEGPPEGAQIEGVVKDDTPKSVVVKIGTVSPNVKELVREFRKLMEPNTATNLRERSYNRIKDYTAVAGQLGLSHLLFISQTKSNVILRVCRFPEGPTVHFKIKQFSLCKHIRAIQRRPYDSAAAYQTPPLIVLNNFGHSDASHIKLVGVTLQHMFPSINVKTVSLSKCRRVILFHYKKDEDLIEMRQYAIRASPVGVNKSVKRVLQTKIPDLGELKDISEFLDGGYMYAGSDSEAEDEASKVTLPERFIGHGNAATQQSALKLVELGPRLCLEAFKVERGVAEGDVMYHKFESKTPEEAEATKRKIEQRNALKEKRRKEQEDNVLRKRERLEEKKNLREERKRQKLEGGGIGGSAADDEDSDDDEDDGDDDEEVDGNDEGMGVADDDNDDDDPDGEGDDEALESDEEDS